MDSPLRNDVVTPFGPGGWGSLGADGSRRSADVAVVGAGISGLVAAERIAATGRSVVVLEARADRVGGRLESAEHNGLVVDLGGACIGAAHTRTRALLDDLGIGMWRAHSGGVRLTANDSHGWGGTARLRRRAVRLDIQRAERRLAALTDAIVPATPWTAPDAARLDERSLGSWADAVTHSARSRATLRSILTNVLCAEPDSVSLLHALFYLRAGGGLAPMIRKDGGAQQDLVVGGSQSLATALAARLGDSVVLGAPVSRIVQERGRVRVESDAVVVDAASAIVAVPPALGSRISYEPSLPAERDRLVRRMRIGDAIKAVVIYDDAFWRHDGMNGEAWGTTLPFSFTHDVSQTDGSPGVMAAFFVGPRATAARLLAPPARRQLVLDGLERSFGPQGAHPIGYMERDWSAEEWSRGGYGTVMPPGVWTRWGTALREPVGLIHWAGTETASEHHGYIEGAVQAGQRAAAEILQTREHKTAVA
ncbi:MAG: monoamine oxidase [Thermoleophilaceae bacterium]|nr:monoamine oxidase [Thermoleophilaceae bacterium]